ncbi:amidohydrolase family protein [Bosea sp. 124]|uniref:amidohydrolase family protein n=1 Tax=Bosea sp. 124 TaxID=2135642 RepID=UPI000D4C6E7C|nr:amidohydrolase family protein [Bosea sp. 124]PTM39844.1 imidazolonepropionase-like amidohydrolase [Bosea sp. 124]
MKTLIKAARLIDGTGAAPVKDPILVIAGGKVEAILSGTVPAEFADAEIHDCPGATILPGLIDTHVHLNLPGDGTLLEEAMRETPGVLMATSTFAVGKALAAGITTVRDVGAHERTAIDLRRALQLGHGEGARVLACGQPITVTGGHTWYFGGEADGEDGVRRKVREMVKLGADFIKVMASGGGTVGTQSWKPSFTPGELHALADEAHRFDRLATAHCLCAQSIDDVIAAGFDQIEHAGFIADRKGNQVYDPAVAERLAKSGIPVTSTLAVGGAVLREMRARTVLTPADQAFLARWEKMAADNMAQFRKLRAAGVSFVAGTDAGWRFTRIDDLPLEIAMMHEGGMSTMEALVAATGYAARVIGLADETGTLKPGLAADVLVVSADPLADLAALRDVRLVMQAGKVTASRQPL